MFVPSSLFPNVGLWVRVIVEVLIESAQWAKWQHYTYSRVFNLVSRYIVIRAQSLIL